MWLIVLIEKINRSVLYANYVREKFLVMFNAFDEVLFHT
jgi:hypothetical protein